MAAGLITCRWSPRLSLRLLFVAILGVFGSGEFVAFFSLMRVSQTGVVKPVRRLNLLMRHVRHSFKEKFEDVIYVF